MGPEKARMVLFEFFAESGYSGHSLVDCSLLITHYVVSILEADCQVKKPW
jgi:hypothetical protein